MYELLKKISITIFNGFCNIASIEIELSPKIVAIFAKVPDLSATSSLK